jgi:hypothetical protein
MSDTPTPRTDAEAYEPNGSGEWVVGVPFARQLERELAAANERIRRLEKAGNDLSELHSLEVGETVSTDWNCRSKCGQRLLSKDAIAAWTKAKEARPC